MAMVARIPYSGLIAIAGIGYVGLPLSVEDRESSRLACGLCRVEEREQEYGA